MLVLLGLATLWRQSKRLEGRLMLLWLVSAGGGLGYGYLWQLLRRMQLPAPSLLPPSHFMFSLRAAEAVLLGFGFVALSALGARAVHFLQEKVIRRSDMGAAPLLVYQTWVLSALLLGTFVLLYPRYVTRDEFVALRADAQKCERWIDMGAYHWIRTHTRPTDVFLASDALGLYLVGAAGRKVVAVYAYFSNPYVDWSRRAADRDMMLRCVFDGDQDRFRALAARYHVTHVVLAVEEAKQVERAARGFLLQEFAGKSVDVYTLPTIPMDPPGRRTPGGEPSL